MLRGQIGFLLGRERFAVGLFVARATRCFALTAARIFIWRYCAEHYP